MIIVPDRYSYIEAYLTLRCNFACEYCINKHTGVKRSREELTAKAWNDGLNRIITKRPITLGGGEPTIHKEFYNIVDGLRNDLRIDLLSNGTFNADEFIKRIPTDRFGVRDNDYYKTIRISFHPHTTNKDEVIGKCSLLNEKGYSVGIFSINHPEIMTENLTMTEKCRRNGIYFFIRDFLGFYKDRLFGHYKYYEGLNGNKKSCLCRTEELLVGPEGSVYRCHRDLYDNSSEIGNIATFKINDDFRACYNFGLCNPCDMKLKLGPDLKVSKCSVEVREK